jgi:alanine racemase
MSLSYIEVSKSALLGNIKAYRDQLGKTKLMAVVKANAYGHGVDVVADVIKDVADWFGVVNISEAVNLRDLGVNKPILVMSYYDEDKIEEALRKNISLVVYDETQLKLLNESAQRLHTQARVHLKIDTGTSRLGVLPDAVLEFAQKIGKLQHIKLEGVFSHLAASEDNAPYTKKQLQTFEEVLSRLDQNGIKPQLRHIACTASASAFPLSRFDLIRLGIGLYGLSSYKARTKANKLLLTPILTWKTRIVQVKDVPKNTYVGYSLTYKTTKASKIAVLPVGYHEGYPRSLSNKGEVLVRGQRCPVRGRVCMNLMMIDVSKVKDVSAGDEVVLIGRQGKDEITADELAKHAGTINYEIVARLNLNIPKVQTA